MPLGSTTKTDFVFKKIKGRRFTDAVKAWYEEFPGSLVFLHAQETWADEVPVPPPGTTTGPVRFFNDLTLTEDTSTANKKAWLACETPGDTNTQLKGFIPPRFHQGYTARIFQDDGSGGMGEEIPTAHPANWLFDYENGVLIFENDPTAYGLTPPFHIQVYQYVGQTVADTSTGALSKKRAFLREASAVTVNAGATAVDVSSIMSGKTPGGNETTTGVVTDPPYNRCPVLSYPDRDEILTEDGNKVYGRLTASLADDMSVTWTLSFYFMSESGEETAYSFPADTQIIWGYYEVLEFNDWPVFDDDVVLPSDQVVGDMPYATTEQAGKVRLAEDNETTPNEVVRADDPRAVKATDFALIELTPDGTNFTVRIGPGVYSANGDKTSSFTGTIAQTASTYYLATVNLNDGTIHLYSSSDAPPATPSGEVALYRWNTEGTGSLMLIEDVRPIYTFSLGGGLGPLGIPPDGTYDDGLLNFTDQTQVNDAVDQINEVLKYLAPEDALPLSEGINWTNTFTSGKVSGGIALNGYYNAGDMAWITRDTTLTGSTPDPSIRWHKADEGTLRFYKNGTEVDSFDLETPFNEAERAGVQSYPPATSDNGYITVTYVGWHNNFPLWQRGNADVTVAGLTVGDYEVYLGHDLDNDGSCEENTTATRFFVDAESARPGMSQDPVLTEDSPQLKYLSGIRFYTLGSTFKVTAQSDDKIFEYTYVDAPMVISFPGMNDVEVAYTDSSVSGVSDPPNYNEQMQITDKIITLDAANQATDMAPVVVTPRDPWGNGTPRNDEDFYRLINTYGNVSTDLEEQFQDENHRLPSTFNFDDTAATIVGNWDSTQLLSNGDAQVFNGTLVYPTRDFTGYAPDQDPGANYSSFSGDQVYYRAMLQDGTPHNSGTLSIGGITFSDLGSNVDIYIKLPGQTGWLDCKEDYNAATFTGADGEGCMTGYSQSGDVLNINWTSGTFSTADSGYRYYVKIVLHNSNKTITYLAETGW